MILKEFFNHHHFPNKYKFFSPPKEVAPFIECLWETNFETDAARGSFLFRDQIFPSVGTSIIINLGNEFKIYCFGEKHTVTSDLAYSRHHLITSTHYAGNLIFGIRMRSNIFLDHSDIDLCKNQPFVAATKVLTPLAITKIKQASSFEERCDIVLNYLFDIVQQQKKFRFIAKNISDSLKFFESAFGEKISMASVAKELFCSKKTLQRHFEKYVGGTPKKCFRILRFRRSLEHYCLDPKTFSIFCYGYFDHSHFYREVKEFTGYNIGALKHENAT